MLIILEMTANLRTKNTKCLFLIKSVYVYCCVLLSGVGLQLGSVEVCGNESRCVCQDRPQRHSQMQLLHVLKCSVCLEREYSVNLVSHDLTLWDALWFVLDLSDFEDEGSSLCLLSFTCPALGRHYVSSSRVPSWWTQMWLMSNNQWMFSVC